MVNPDRERDGHESDLRMSALMIQNRDALNLRIRNFPYTKRIFVRYDKRRVEMDASFLT